MSEVTINQNKMPINAARLNALQIREQQHLNRERRAQQESEEQRKEQRQAAMRSKYNHVPSHIAALSPAKGKADNTVNDDVQINVYVRECDGDQAQMFSFMENQELTGTSSRPAPRQGSEATTHKMQGKVPAAVAHRMPTGKATAGASSAAVPPAAKRGKVPLYLQQRKAELQAEKQLIEDQLERRKELAKVPYGHRVVTEEEKLSTLQRLEDRRKELESQLHRIPIRFDTLSIRNRRRSIEGELAEIEEAKVKYATKKPLYVPIA